MTEAGQRSGYLPTGARAYPLPGRSGWTAWIIFAGVILSMIGIFHVIAGLVALFENEYYVADSSGLVLKFDFTAWGWGHLLFGLLVLTTAFGAMVGQTWARVVGVCLAVISTVANMLFIAAYPMWSIVIITLDVVVIYALIVHGRELKDA